MGTSEGRPYRAAAMCEAIKRHDWQSVRELAEAVERYDAARIRAICDRITAARLPVADAGQEEPAGGGRGDMGDDV